MHRRIRLKLRKLKYYKNAYNNNYITDKVTRLWVRFNKFISYSNGLKLLRFHLFSTSTILLTERKRKKINANKKDRPKTRSNA